jgi:hypothetical protein
LKVESPSNTITPAEGGTRRVSAGLRDDQTFETSGSSIERFNVTAPVCPAILLIDEINQAGLKKEVLHRH